MTYDHDRDKYKLFSVGAIGTFMATLDGSILNVALPTISKDLAVPVDMVAWVVLSYSLTLISLMLVFGAWAGVRGYFFAYRFGYALFIAGSTLCALSSDLALLLTGRVVQAFGTAMFSAVGPGMVTQVFPSRERGKGIGMMVMMVSAGFMVGPPAGGFLLSIWPWQSVFVINIPIGIIGLSMTYRYFSKVPPPENTRPIRLRGAVSISVSLVALTFALSFLNDFPWTDIRIWGTALFSLVTFCLFLWFESQPDSAMIGTDIFQNRQFTTAIGAMLFMFMATAGVLLLVPFYLENIKHFEPSQVGMFLIILPIIMFITAPLSGRASDRIGYRLLTSGGVIILIAGLAMLTGLDINSEGFYIVSCLIVVGIGTGIFNTPNSSALMGSVSEQHRAVTSGILGTTRNIGMSIGVALSTALFSYFRSHHRGLDSEDAVFLAGYHDVILVSMAIASVSLIFSLIRGKRESGGANKSVDNAE